MTCSTMTVVRSRGRPGEIGRSRSGGIRSSTRAERGIGRVSTRDLQSPELPVLLHDIDGAPVGDIVERPARVTVASVCS